MPNRFHDENSPAQSRAYFARLRALSVAERVEIVCRLNRTMRALAEANLRRAYPHAGEEELRKRLAVRLRGRQVAERLTGPLPDDAR